jgi:hypothetical protein
MIIVEYEEDIDKLEKKKRKRNPGRRGLEIR